MTSIILYNSLANLIYIPANFKRSEVSCAIFFYKEKQCYVNFIIVYSWSDWALFGKLWLDFWCVIYFFKKNTNYIKIKNRTVCGGRSKRRCGRVVVGRVGVDRI